MRLSLSALLLIACGTHAAFGQAAPSPAPSSAPAAGADRPFAQLEAEIGAANAAPGPRTVPAKVVPVPDTVSPQFRTAVAAPYRVPAWNANPPDAAAWKALVDKLAAAGPPPSPPCAKNSASPASPR